MALAAASLSEPESSPQPFKTTEKSFAQVGAGHTVTANNSLL